MAKCQLEIVFLGMQGQDSDQVSSEDASCVHIAHTLQSVSIRTRVHHVFCPFANCDLC